jgi:hypothetical protein
MTQNNKAKMHLRHLLIVMSPMGVRPVMGMRPKITAGDRSNTVFVANATALVKAVAPDVARVLKQPPAATQPVQLFIPYGTSLAPVGGPLPGAVTSTLYVIVTNWPIGWMGRLGLFRFSPSSSDVNKQGNPGDSQYRIHGKANQCNEQNICSIDPMCRCRRGDTAIEIRITNIRGGQGFQARGCKGNGTTSCCNVACTTLRAIRDRHTAGWHSTCRSDHSNTVSDRDRLTYHGWIRLVRGNGRGGIGQIG